MRSHHECSIPAEFQNSGFARRHETAALREFELTYVGLGSKSVFVISAARPLFHQEQTFVGTLRTAVSCHNALDSS